MINIQEVNICMRMHKESEPSSQTIRALNSLLFFISDVRHGIGPLISIFLKVTLSWDPGKIGLALAMPDLAAAIFQLPAGLSADTTRKKRLLIAIPCLLIIFCCFLILKYSSFMNILFAQFLMGISIAFIAPGISSVTLGLFGRKKFPLRVSRNEMWNHAGNVFTALTAGVASYLIGNYGVFYVVIAFGIASLVSLFLIRPQEINYKNARELPEKDPFAKPIPFSHLLKRFPVIIFNISLVLYYITNGAQIALVSQKLAGIYPEITALFIAGCMMIAEMTMVFVAYLMGLVVNRFGRKLIFLIAFAILPIRATLYTLTDNPALLLSIQILDGTAAGILGVIGSVINSDLGIGTGHFNFLQGLSAFSISIGVFISNLFAGLVVSYYGFEAGFLTLAIIGILGVFFFLLFMPETGLNKMASAE